MKLSLLSFVFLVVLGMSLDYANAGNKADSSYSENNHKGDPLPTPQLSADCSSTSAKFWGKDSKKGAVGYLEFQKIKMELPGTYHSYIGYHEILAPIYSNHSFNKINSVYSLGIEIRVEKDQGIGDFLADSPRLTMAASLFKSGVRIGSMMSQTERISTNYQNDKVLEINGHLDNSIIRTELESKGNISWLLEASVSDLLADSKRKDEIFSRHSQSGLVLTNVDIDCRVKITWVPTEEFIYNLSKIKIHPPVTQ